MSRRTTTTFQTTKDILEYLQAPDNHVILYKTKLKNMNFGQALEFLKSNKKVARSGWNGVGLWLELQIPDSNSKMTLPYIYINYPLDAKTTPGCKVPWLASQTDMLAEDWNQVL